MTHYEPATGVRLSGILDAGRGSTKRIWDGPPPVMPDGTLFRVLAISAEVDATIPSQTVTVHVAAGSSQGGFTVREFSVGGGLIAILKVGNYPNVRAIVTTNIPVGMRVRWAWSEDTGMQPTPLFTRLNYTVGAAIVALPQGTEVLYPQNACVITWQLGEFGATIAQAAAAGVPLPAIWGSFASNIAPNQFLLQMQGF
jgi:hypothetical protein